MTAWLRSLTYTHCRHCPDGAWRNITHEVIDVGFHVKACYPCARRIMFDRNTRTTTAR